MTVWSKPALWWRVAITLAALFGLTFHDASLTYYTTQSSVIVLAYFGGAVYWMIRRGTVDAPAPRLRGAVTFWITVTGLVSHFLLENGANPLPGLFSADDRVFEWTIFTLHYVTPAMVFLDWLVFSPHRAVPWRDVPLWLLYPLEYGLFVEFRAAVHPAFPEPYPYFFLDPTEHGYLWVAMQFGMLTAGFLVLAVVMLGVERLLYYPRPEGEAALAPE